MIKVPQNNAVKSKKNKKILFDDEGNTVDVEDIATNHKHSNGPSNKKLNNKAQANIESDFARWYEEVSKRTFLNTIGKHIFYSNTHKTVC